MMCLFNIVHTWITMSIVIFLHHTQKKYRYSIQTIPLLIFVLFPKVSYGSSCGDSVLPPVENPRDGICGDMDVRNSVKNFRMLDNCTVIEGSLHISLMDYVIQEEYNKYSFPLLREITGHFMMFRVFGLRTLRNMFPNLTVIRGQTKFFNDFALVAYEMRDLEELGLVGLTLVNGSVRLTKNHRLCYISSIDWKKLAGGVDYSNLFLDNREEQLCPDYCNESCSSSSYEGITRRRCWTSKADDCQRNLACQCPLGVSCSINGTCCHEQCAGGCSGPTASDCFVCSKVIYKNECLSECPFPETYMLSNRRCLTKIQCLSLLSHSAQINRSDIGDNFPKLLAGNGVSQNQCVFKCPPGYAVNDKETHHYSECRPCDGFCPKVCNTTIVNSIEDSEKLFGCSKIDGSLEIQISGGKNIDFELTKNLGAIREITGNLKIWKSYPLLTLHFFQDLEIIGGEKLMHKGYSLFVADNTNLQEIFPEKQIKKMSIRKGRIGFHGNRKLCTSKLFSFANQINITSPLPEKDIDISNTSNGNLVPCASITFNVTLKFYPGLMISGLLVIEWNEFDAGDSRQLINYVVSYKEVKEQVRDIYQGRDACSDNDWKTDYVDTKNSHSLTNLQAFTKYAIYVQANVLPTASVSADSRIIYFQTSTFAPSDPVDLRVSAAYPEELTIKWNPPKNPNGEVTHYKVFYQMGSPSTNAFEQRDFCKDPYVGVKEEAKKTEAKTNLDTDKKQMDSRTEKAAVPCCDCPISEEERLKQERIREMEILFENDVHNSAYRKKWKACTEHLKNHSIDNKYTSSRSRREANTINNFDHPILFKWPPQRPPKDEQIKNISAVTSNENASNSSTSEFSNPVIQEVITYDTKATLPNLEHFQSYTIKVMACHETDPDSGTKLCGASAVITHQTASNPTADNLNSSLVTVESSVNKSGEVQVKWEPPIKPNGLILKYDILYKKADVDRSSIPVVICVSAKKFQNNSNGYLLQGLLPGNYSLQICAHSLAGKGKYTREVFFFVFPPQGGGEDENLSMIIGVCFGLLILIIVVFLALLWYYKCRYNNKDVIVSPNPQYIPADFLYPPDEWEISRDNIRLLKELGQGSFGTVFEGIMEDSETKKSIPVAVKTVNDKADFHERIKILKEATTMKGFNCHHVVQLLGVVSKGQPALVVMELMALGDLKNYLRNSRPDEENCTDLLPPTNEQMHQMAAEIADGMAYLSDKKIVHRDLAARNCLIAADRTVKIADFGMARDVYTTEYYRRDKTDVLPIRWMAPESIKDGIFTTMSDVWSFGVVLWEIVTLAEQPYQGLANDEVLRSVIGGCRINIPNSSPADLSEMMRKCWSFEPKERPSFKSLIEQLVPYLNEKFFQVSYCFQDPYQAEIDEKENNYIIEVDDLQLTIENEKDKDYEPDHGFNRELSLMGESSVVNDGDSEKDYKYIEHGNVDNLLTAHSGLNFGSLPKDGSSHSNQSDQFPLIQHQNNVQVPTLYPGSFSAGNIAEVSDYYSDDDVDDDIDFNMKDNKNYSRPSKDARLLSERLKLLSNSSDNSRPKLNLLPAKTSAFTTKPSVADEYELMSPVSINLPKAFDDKPQASSPSVLVHPATSPAAVSTTPPFSLAKLLPSIAPSTSPVLHVDMEGIGNIRGTNQKQLTPINMKQNEGNDGSWIFHNSNPTINSNARNSHMKLSDSSSNSNSISSSIHSGSEGSKDSSSSSGSHHRFNPGSANGHGPFTHQQAALC